MDATLYGSMENDMGQLIEFVEHPLLGDEAPIICMCRELELAQESEFWDLHDMKSNDDYMPLFLDGKLIYKYEMYAI